MKTVTVKKAPRLALASIKTFEGHDGQGLNADLYFDGKKVAFVLDEAHGGEMYIQWMDGFHSPTYAHIVNYIASLNLPTETIKCEEGSFPQVQDLEVLINETVDWWHNQKRIGRLTKGNILFRTPNEEYGVFFKVAHEGQPETCKTRILKKLPNAIFIEPERKR